MTAVEWLIDKLQHVNYNPLEKDGYSIAVDKLHKQAKQIEAEQRGYTEEQVREALEMAQSHHETEYIIQSLKQSKL